MTLGAEREEPRHVWGHATLEVLPGGAAVEAGDGRPIAPQAPKAERRPSSDVALGQAARVGAWPLDDVGEPDPEVEQPAVELGAE